LARTPWAPGAPALAGAARAVDAVLSEGQSADAALVAAESLPERAAIRAITLGTLRWYLRLAPALETLVARPAGVSGVLRALLVAAAHQVEYSRNAPELTVHAAVDATQLLGEPRAAGLANAVLRRFVAEREALLARVDRRLAQRTAYPPWLVETLVRAWPGRVEEMLDAGNVHPPMTLRVDLSRVTREAYLGTLANAGIGAKGIQWIDSAVVLDRPVSISELPGFGDGLVSVQDAGAQLAAVLLAIAPGQRVLDACAAPGGKTGQLLERAGGAVDLLAVDLTAERIGLVEENLRRLRREARTLVADLRDPEALTDAGFFDRILVDAPCSSTGVIRRHPDIKLLRRSTDIGPFAEGQLQILRQAAAQLAPGGRLLYSTCSLLAAENEAVVHRLLKEVPALAVAVMPPAGELAPGAVERPVGVQLLPGAEAGTDGFYYACLEKTTAGT
jgi:16S rRNA (cytosine967-C5)-methyltransferase